MTVFRELNVAWFAWLCRVWREILCGFNLGFVSASLLVGATALTNVIGWTGVIIYVGASALHIWRTKRRKPDVPEVAP